MSVHKKAMKALFICTSMKITLILLDDEFTSN